jgi:predicted flap endonuclease-1-like 5' DNA nuclease
LSKRLYTFAAQTILNINPSTFMNLQQLVEALDARVLKGDIIAAFEDFAADNCVTLSGPTDITHSKAQKMDALRGFFSNIAAVKNIERFGVKIDGNVTESQFTFEMANHWGETLSYSEIIRRTWKNDKVVEEYYLLNQVLGETESVPVEKAKTTKAKGEKAPEAPKAEKAPKVEKAAAPKVEKKPAAKATKADDLTIIEGIGPKIAELLINADISTFAKLAATKPTDIKAVLEAAGKRYQMHDPSTWPQQAALARDGKTAELNQLQDQLNAGRK